MSSIINTVFPTPAPPNNPILPPFRYGSSKSITLIPVTKKNQPALKAGFFMPKRLYSHFKQHHTVLKIIHLNLKDLLYLIIYAVYL
jgi:hypothetical protein